MTLRHKTRFNTSGQGFLKRPFSLSMLSLLVLTSLGKVFLKRPYSLSMLSLLVLTLLGKVF